MRPNFCEDWNMQIVLRRNAMVVLAVSLVGSGFSSHVAKASTSQTVAAAPVVKVSDRLLPAELLDRARLRTVWQMTLPLKPGEKFDTIALLGDRLYLRSDRNYLWSLDAAKGDMVFSRSAAPESIPMMGLVVHGDDLISLVGNQIVEYSVATGIERRVANPGLSVVTPPVRNSQYFYLAAADRRLHALRTKDLVRMFQVAPENDSLITTVLADEEMAVFGTNEGNVIAIAADGPRKLWEFKVPEAVAGSIIRDGDSFYFACRDTNVYRIDAGQTASARLGWRFQAEAVLDRAPRVTDRYVYQYAPGRGLTAIEKGSGQAIWSLADGLDLLAEADGKAYVITRIRTLTVMDNASGKRLYSVNWAPVIGHASNTQGARMYVVDEHGRVACIEPTR